MMNMHNEEPVSWSEKLGFKPLDLLKLDKFISPTILLVLYWISMVGGLLLSVFTLISGLIGLFQHFLVGVGTLLIGILMLFLLPLYTRVLFEMLIAFFKIHSHLKIIREATVRVR